MPIVNGIFFPMAFLSGAFFPLPLGSVGNAIMEFLPGRSLMTLFTGAVSEQGPSWDVRSMLVLLAWGIAGTVVSVRWFRWASEREPRGFSSRNKAAAVDEG